MSNNNLSFKDVINNSPSLTKLKQELIISTKLSLTGITNLVVNYENPLLVDEFLKSCFTLGSLYRNSVNIDAVELQNGSPGAMNSYNTLDQLIYGTIKTNVDQQLGIEMPIINPQTGAREREMDGFVNRQSVLTKQAKDMNFIIRNVDASIDFCCNESPGEIHLRSLDLFNKFRHSKTRNTCRLILVTDIPLKLPFSIRTIQLSPLSDYEAKDLLNNFVSLYFNHGYTVNLSESTVTQIARKLCGLTHTVGGDIIGACMAKSENPKSSKIIDQDIVLKSVRREINERFISMGNGLTQLNSRPWNDYICPTSSNFTWDVKKMLRDLREIDRLNAEMLKNANKNKFAETIEQLQMRIPHVIMLYGQGGTGKSAFPIHFAGLLGFDVWDFNINSLHSKYVGEGSERARNSIEYIMKASHVVIRIDEYDRAIGGSGNTSQGMHEAHKQVESELMAWLQNAQEDNMFTKQNIFVVLTTNHKENITGPMLRSGRVDLVIDIADFDSNSIKNVFLTASERMKNRGVKVLGIPSYEDLHQKIQKLDLTMISKLCAEKRFTVRDVEILISEIAAYDYYNNSPLNDGIINLNWSTETFMLILEHSEGSMKPNGETGELILGDRNLQNH